MRARRALVLLATLCLARASPSLAAWQTFDTVSGLPNNQVLCVAADSAGGLWFGTADGAARFDGVRFRLFTRADGLVHDVVQAVRVDHLGRVWLGTPGGVSVWDGARLQSFAVGDGLAHNDVHSIVEDGEGRLWFATEAGISTYDGSHWRTFTTADGLPADFTWTLALAPSGAVWAATHNGASRFDGAAWWTPPDQPFEVGFTRASTVTRDGRVWFATTGGGVLCFDGTTWLTFTTADGLPSNYTGAILEDRLGSLWVGTFEGAARMEKRGWSIFTHQNGLPDSEVRALAEDGAGNLWFGTFAGGVARWDGDLWRRFGLADGLPAPSVGDILVDRAGDVWFASPSGVTRFDGSTWRTYGAADGLGAAICLLEDRGGTLWAGTATSGACRFDGSAWTCLRDSLPDGQVLAIAQDSAGVHWFGTPRGLSRYDGASWRTYTADDGLGDNFVPELYVDHTGNLWVGSAEHGVVRFDGTTWRSFTTADGLAGNQVFDIAGDEAEALWFATGEGASRYDGTSWRTYTTADGLANNLVTRIFPAGSGVFWFGTREGLTRWDGERWIRFLARDGMASDGVSALAQDDLGRLWIGAGLGLGDRASLYEPDRAAPRTVIVSTLPGVVGTREVEFSFLPAFGEVGIEFAYVLDENPWSPWSPINSARVGPPLVDGIHVFRVRARDRFGLVEPDPRMRTFEVDATPPSPLLISPVFGQAVRDTVIVQGIVGDPRFRLYTVEARPVGSSSWSPPEGTLLVEESEPPQGQRLATWNTRATPDGPYELRLVVQDTLGLVGTVQVTAIVDNLAPDNNVTSPALVHAFQGGHVFTTNGEVELYFPPGAFAEDQLVRIDPFADPGLAAPSGSRWLSGWELIAGQRRLDKPATLTLRTPGIPVGDAVTIFRIDPGRSLVPLGGTRSADGTATSVTVTTLDSIVVYAGGAVAGPGFEGVRELDCQPRVLSPKGGGFDTRLAISFELGKGGTATVKVYDRSGRLVRELAESAVLPAGRNVIFWDGKDVDGEVVPSGLYVVAVGVDDQKAVRTVAVANR